MNPTLLGPQGWTGSQPLQECSNPRALEQNQLADFVSLCLLCICLVLSSCPFPPLVSMFSFSLSLSFVFLLDFVPLCYFSTTLSSPFLSLSPSDLYLSLHHLPLPPLICLLFCTVDCGSILLYLCSALLFTSPHIFHLFSPLSLLYNI